MARAGKTLRGIDRALPIALLKAREQTMSRFRPMLSRYDITEQQWRVLRVLSEANGEALDATEVAERSIILSASLSRILINLEKRGLLSRQKSEGDSRRWAIAIEARGRDLIKEIAPQSEAIYREIEALFEPGELNQLLNLMERLDQG